MKKDFHEQPFNPETLTKLELFRLYISSWLPVFLHTTKARPSRIQIFDFFAGPGTDSEGTPGSPLIAAEEISNALQIAEGKDIPPVRLYLNEYKKKNFEVLKNKTALQIRQMNPSLHIHLSQKEFQDAFREQEANIKDPHTANFVFLDQFGIKEMTQEVFLSLTTSKRTDFIFFISSSIVNRFKEDPNITRYIPKLSQKHWEKMDGDQINRILLERYRTWLPLGYINTYFLSAFSLKKGANVYGLIFGSGHPLGMDKFLTAAWQMDPLTGEANFDIDQDGIDLQSPYIFAEMNKSTKLLSFERKLEKLLSEKQFRTNHDLYIYGLRNGMLSKHVKDVVDQMQKSKKFPKQQLNISYNAWKKHPQTIQYANGEG